MSKQHCIVPTGYQSALSIRETEVAIKKLKDYFQIHLAQALNLTRVSAPLFIVPESGLNDNLSGTETAVSFTAPYMIDSSLEIVHSLAKWKRMALHRYGFTVGEGLYTDMNAIRREEAPDNIHSLYVDQWDWEQIITPEMRTIAFLQETVKKIYAVYRDTEAFILNEYPELPQHRLPEDLFFITTQELDALYPNQTPEEREAIIAQEHGAVFIHNIGHVMASGVRHGHRSPDYDDWNLNGDIIFWNELLEIPFEVSSMGIRVNSESLVSQLKIAGNEDRLKMEYHQLVENDTLPLTIGGGLGQSRLCMYCLRKAHIGEVQVSIWDEATVQICAENGIELL